MEDRLRNEIKHGATEAAVRQAESGWNSPAGRVRSGRRIDFLVEGLGREAAVLELGAGTGIQTARLLRHFDKVVGIDISEALLAIARNRAPEGIYEYGDAHNLVFPDSSFDAVLGVSILHHLDWDRCVGECYRVLKPGGVMRFSEPNLLNPQIFLQKNIGFLKRLAGDSPDEYAFTRWQIRSSMSKAGFKKIKIRPYEFLHPATPEKLIPFVSAMEKFLSLTPLAEFGGSLLIEGYKET